jgi:hypothetical protein
MARTYNITIDSGSKFEFTVQVQNSDGTPRDLTGYTARMWIKKSRTASISEIQLANGSGITITPLTGMITVSMTDNQTEALTIKSGVYDLKIEAAGLEERVLQGGVVLSPQVTE